MLFGYRSYYPYGGLEDLKGYYNSLDEIIKSEEFEECFHELRWDFNIVIYDCKIQDEVFYVGDQSKIATNRGAIIKSILEIELSE